MREKVKNKNKVEIIRKERKRRKRNWMTRK